MGIFGALTTAVAGLRAQSFALENISGNIANSQTTASSASTPVSSISFRSTALTAQLAGGVTAHRAPPIRCRATCSPPPVATYHGDQRQRLLRGAEAGHLHRRPPVFDGVDLYTRRGDFQVDKNGYLVNGAGYYLRAFRSIRRPATRSGSVAAGAAIPERLPAGAGDHSDQLPRQPRQLSADHQARHLGSGIGIDRSRVDSAAGHNPLVLGTPAAPFTDASVTGSAQNNKAPRSPTGATTLSGAAPQQLVTRISRAGDTITVNGTTLSPSWPPARAAISSTSPTTSRHCLPRSTRSPAGTRPRSPAASSRCIPAPRQDLSISSSNAPHSRRLASPAP